MLAVLILVATSFMILVAAVHPPLGLFFIPNPKFHVRKLAMAFWVVATLLTMQFLPAPQPGRPNRPLTINDYLNAVDSLSAIRHRGTTQVLDSITKRYPQYLDTAVYILARNIQHEYPDSAQAFFQYLVGKNLTKPDERYSLEIAKLYLEQGDTTLALSLLHLCEEKHPEESEDILDLVSQSKQNLK